MLFVNEYIAIKDSGEYATSYLANEHMLPRATKREPVNASRIVQAKRARELGLSVEEPAPVWEPAPDVPVGGTLEEIRYVLVRAAQSIRFQVDVPLGRKIVESWSLHDMHCQCGQCPWEARYSDEREIGDVFAPAEGMVPESWWAPEESGYSQSVIVQTSDGCWLFKGWLRGGANWGTLCDTWTARRYRAPDEVCERLEALRREWNERCEARQAEKALAERQKLAKLFGIENV